MYFRPRPDATVRPTLVPAATDGYMLISVRWTLVPIRRSLDPINAAKRTLVPVRYTVVPTAPAADHTLVTVDTAGHEPIPTEIPHPFGSILVNMY